MTNNDSAGLLETPEVSTREQRNWTRFKPEETETFLFLDRVQIHAEITDESFDGVGVIADERLDLQAGDSIELIYYGVPVRGVVRSVSQQGEQTRLGIQWMQRRRENPNTGRSRCRTESDFVLIGGIPVACRIVDRTSNKVRVRLPDQTEFNVAAEEVCVIDRFQRLAHLKEADGELRVLAGLYELGDIQSTGDALRVVLNLEFAQSWD